MNLKKSISVVLLGSVLCLSSFLSFEGAVVKAVDYQSTTTSTVTTTPGLSFILNLGVTSELRMLCPTGPIAMGSIPSMTGGTATASADCNVMTNNPAGYTLWVHATSTGSGTALASVAEPGTYGFENYSPNIGVSSPHNYVVNSASSTFGFAITSAEAPEVFKSLDTGGNFTCNDVGSVGAADGTCWRGFETVEETDIMIASSAAASATSAGVTTTLNFKAAVGSASQTDLPVGAYRATIVVTGVQN